MAVLLKIFSLPVLSYQFTHFNQFIQKILKIYFCQKVFR